MNDRKSFLAMLSMMGMSLSFAARGDATPTAAPATGSPAATAPASDASAMPEATAAASAVPKPPSQVALAAARAMRRFDPKLSDAEIDTIARGIDGNATAGARLNPRKKRLSNGDEPITTFTVPHL